MGDAVKPALGIERAQPGGEDRKVHVENPGSITRQAVEDHAHGSMSASSRGQQLSPQGAAPMTLCGGNEHVACL